MGGSGSYSSSLCFCYGGLVVWGPGGKHLLRHSLIRVIPVTMVQSTTPSEDAVVVGQQKLDLVEDSAEMAFMLTPTGILECMAHVMMRMTTRRCAVTKQPLAPGFRKDVTPLFRPPGGLRT